jgi:hypothetical protein
MADCAPFFKKPGILRLNQPGDYIKRPVNKDFEYPKSPALTGPELSYDANTKHTPVVIVGGVMTPITEFADHAAFMAAACDPANEAGFLDTVYRKSYPEAGICHDDDSCTNALVYTSGVFNFALRSPAKVSVGDTVKWTTDANTAAVAPFHGEVVPGGGEGFQVIDICCESECGTVKEVSAIVDFTKHSCP